MRVRGSGAGVRWVMAAVILVAVAVAAMAWIYRGGREVAVHWTVPAGERQVNVLALADWGDDTYAQQDVARAMAAYVGKPGRGPFSAVLLAGDNFYMPLAGVEDPAWDRMFERMFDRQALAMPFYAVLGNHDYRNGKDLVELEYARVRPESRWKMPARWYRLELPDEANPLVTVLMLDSNYPALGEERFEAEMEWLRGELAKPRVSPWLVVCAHHPLYSNGEHGDNARLIARWGPLFREHGVDLYLAGHDHDMQHLEIEGEPTSFIICGGGGAHTRTMSRSDRGPFSREMNGFVHLRFGERSCDVVLLDKSGRAMHAFSRAARAVGAAEEEGAAAAARQPLMSGGGAAGP